jgi:hypothetical protein
MDKAENGETIREIFQAGYFERKKDVLKTGQLMS